jgi:hypothetical protein
VDFFLNIPGVHGSSKDADHAQEFELQSFQMLFRSRARGTGGAVLSEILDR